MAGREIAKVFAQRMGRYSGGAAGISASVLAMGGDAQTAIENLALREKIFVSTVDPSRDLLPQLPAQQFNRVVFDVLNVADAILTGDAGDPGD